MKPLALAALLLAAAPVAAQTDSSFAPCAACHSVKPGQNRIGPSLAGVVGRKVASVPGFAYSPALKAKGGAWTDAALDAYIADPRKAVPGGKMIYAGMPDAAKRGRLIAWLKTQ